MRTGTLRFRSWQTAMMASMLALSPVTAAAQSSSISVSGDPPALVVTTAIAGSAPLSVSSASTTYSVLAGAAGQSITGVLDAALPAGVTLELQLAAPSGAVSRGLVALSLVPQTLVQDIPAGDFRDLVITYRFSAQTSAGVVPLSARAVSLAISP